jgi:hypothetical protein
MPHRSSDARKLASWVSYQEFAVREIVLELACDARLASQQERRKVQENGDRHLGAELALRAANFLHEAPGFGGLLLERWTERHGGRHDRCGLPTPLPPSEPETRKYLSNLVRELEAVILTLPVLPDEGD